jgi:Golgi apparatus protein 1
MCLQNKLEELTEECKTAIKQFTEDESKDIRLDQILMKSCLPIITEFCAEAKNEGRGDLLECLIKQKNNPKIEPKCRYGIEHHQLINLKNINFNYKFKRSCEKNIKTFCPDLNDKADIIQCLSAYVLNDTLLEDKHRIDPLCRSQLRFELLQMNEDVRLDPSLYKVCADDINEHCANIPFGKAQVLECLKSNMDKLSTECSKKLTNRKRVDLIDQSVDFKLKEKCKSAIMEFCSSDDGDVLTCLRKSLLQPSMDSACRQVVINRIMTQNKDVRLNPTLWKACRKDTVDHCQREFSSLENGEELNGRVISCLKSKFVENVLSRDCGLEIEQIMREAANIDYRLDPLLTEACFSEIHDLCAEETENKKEDCLRLQFQQKKIQPSSNCYKVSF